jgi:hypothetical protein
MAAMRVAAVRQGLVFHLLRHGVVEKGLVVSLRRTITAAVEADGMAVEDLHHNNLAEAAAPLTLISF